MHLIVVCLLKDNRFEKNVIGIYLNSPDIVVSNSTSDTVTCFKRIYVIVT